MATTALSSMRELLSETRGQFISGTTTGTGNAGGTTAVDTGVQVYDTGWLANKWLLLTSGNNSGEFRRISSVTTTTITVVSAYTNQIASSVTYEIHDFDPTFYQNALNRAGQALFPDLYLHVRDRSIMVDNLLSNFDFETFSGGAFTGWASGGTPTLAAETSRVVHGTNSASVTATGATEGIEQNIFTSVNYNEMVGKTLRVRAWVFATVASSARIRVTFDGSTFTNGDYHGGDHEWEGPNLMYINVDIPAGATEMTISCEVTSGNAAFFDVVGAWVDPIHRYTLPTTLVTGPHHVRQQAERLYPDGVYYPIPVEGPRPGQLLHFEGMGVLSAPSTESGTIEIGEPRLRLLIAEAGVHLHRILAGYDRANREEHLADAVWWRMESDRLRRQPGIRMRPLGADAPENVWRVDEDASGRYLNFLGVR